MHKSKKSEKFVKPTVKYLSVTSDTIIVNEYFSKLQTVWFALFLTQR